MNSCELIDAKIVFFIFKFLFLESNDWYFELLGYRLKLMFEEFIGCLPSILLKSVSIACWLIEETFWFPIFFLL